MSRHAPWTVLEVERSEMAALHYDDHDDDRERYNPADEERRRVSDPYTGTCPACGGRVSPSLPGGSCLWRPPGPWHPACRAADKAAGGTQHA